jgi:hypothetical protein
MFPWGIDVEVPSYILGIPGPHLCHCHPALAVVTVASPVSSYEVPVFIFFFFFFFTIVGEVRSLSKDQLPRSWNLGFFPIRWGYPVVQGPPPVPQVVWPLHIGPRWALWGFRMVSGSLGIFLVLLRTTCPWSVT